MKGLGAQIVIGWVAEGLTKQVDHREVRHPGLHNLTCKSKEGFK
jgi:hypothetical protein